MGHTFNLHQVLTQLESSSSVMAILAWLAVTPIAQLPPPIPLSIAPVSPQQQFQLVNGPSGPVLKALGGAAMVEQQPQQTKKAPDPNAHWEAILDTKSGKHYYKDTRS